MTERGVFIERSVGNSVLVTAVGHGGEVLLTLRVAAEWWDPDLLEHVRAWLDRAAPPLTLVR